MIAAMDPTTIFGFLIASVTGLAAWIGVSIKNSNAKHEKCELDKDLLETRVNTMEADMSLFKSCATNDCGAKAAFERREAFSVNSNRR